MGNWLRGPVALVGLVICAYLALQVGLAIIGLIGYGLEVWWSG